MGKVFNFSRGADTFLNIDRAYASRFPPLPQRYAFLSFIVIIHVNFHLVY